MPGFFEELKRRNVVRVGIAYVVIAWVIAQVAELALDSFAAPEWVMKTLLLLLFLGLPLALFFAWAFELTPEGVKREKDVDRSQSITHKTGRKLDKFIIAVLVFAVGFLLVDKFMLQSGPAELAEQTSPTTTPAAAIERSIAVLPFANMSNDPEQEYFADGISEELLNLLARVPKLKVAARTSSFAFKGRNENISQIADELKVSKVLEGSVRKSGTRLRITAQLIEAKTGYHLWSATYDRELDDVFAIQDEISAAIVGALKQTLGLSAAAPRATRTANQEAYSAYLEGRQLMEQRGQGPLEQSQLMLEKAIALDPEFAPAYSSLAEAVLLLPGYTGGQSRHDATDRARMLIERALALAPDSADTLVAQALLLAAGERRSEESIKLFDRALGVNPSMVRALMWRAQSLGLVGRYDEQFESLRKAVALDPLGYVPVRKTADALLQRGRFDEALAIMQRLVRVRPSAISYTGTGELYEQQGLQDRAHEMHLRARAIAPDNDGIRRSLMLIYWKLDMAEPLQPLVKTGFDELLPLWLEHRFQEAAQVGENLLAKEPSDSVSAIRWVTARAQVYADNAQRAIELYQPFVERTEGHIGPLFGTGSDSNALYLFASRRAVGDEKGALELLGDLRAHHDEAITAGFVDPRTKFRGAQILALEGRHKEALAALREVLASGWVEKNLLDYLPFRPLHDDSEFRQIAADYERERERQRNEIRKQLATDKKPT